MQVTGYMLREAIKRWQLRRDTAAAQFSETLARFKDEDKPSPDDTMTAFTNAEKVIANLQAAQAEYNLHVEVTPKGFESMSLCAAVKLVGGIGRAEKMWRDAAAPARGRYNYDNNLATREKDREQQIWTLSPKEMTERAIKWTTIAGGLRAAIAEANSAKVDLKGLDSSYFSE